MRCKSCDDLLNDREACRKDLHGRYTDLCGPCYTVSTQTIVEKVEEINKEYPFNMVNIFDTDLSFFINF